MKLTVTSPSGMWDIVHSCVSNAEVRDREGNVGRGFTNLKRVLGHPPSFASVVDELARTVPPGHAIVACDEGAWALVGALALRLGVPAVLVRREPKTYFLAYGDDPSVGDGRLVGERLPAGTRVHLVDDLIYSGSTLRSAMDALELVELTATSASAVLWTRRAEAATAELAERGLLSVTCLVSQMQEPE